MSAQIVAIIPARGGSKGIPRKNLLPLAGKPLLAHSIFQAKQTPGITRVVVSTDDAEIAAVARERGAEAVPRPPEIGDTASSESALLHALDYLEKAEGGNLKPEGQLEHKRRDGSGKGEAQGASRTQLSGFSPHPSSVDAQVSGLAPWSADLQVSGLTPQPSTISKSLAAKVGIDYTGAMRVDYQKFIDRHGQICGGEPVIRGTRVTVRTVLASLAEGASVEQIVADFPTVSREAVLAMIAFAAASAQEDLPVPPAPSPA